MEIHKSHPFSMFPTDLIGNEKITYRQIVLYAFLTSLSQQKGYAFASNEYLAKRLNISVRSVQRDLQSLFELDLIRIELFKIGVNNSARKIFILAMTGLSQGDRFVTPPTTDLSQPSDRFVTHNNISNNYIKKNNKETNKDKSLLVKKKSRNLPKSVDEVIAYFKENNQSESLAIKFYKYYNDVDWVDSNGNKIKVWKLKAKYWFEKENKIQTKINTNSGLPKSVL